MAGKRIPRGITDPNHHPFPRLLEIIIYLLSMLTALFKSWSMRMPMPMAAELVACAV